MRVADRIFMSSTFGRTYLVEGPDGYVMIDTYTMDGVRAALAEYERDDGLDLTRLRALLLTHLHYDHAAGAAHIRAEYDVPVVCHTLDAEAIVAGDRNMTAADIAWQNVSAPVPSCTIDHMPEDGDRVVVAGLTFDVVHLPGHSRGGVAYILDGHAFTGDTIMPGGRIGWSDVHWGSNLPDHADSVRKLQDTGAERIYGGHGDPEDITDALYDTALDSVRRLIYVGLPSSVSVRVEPRDASDVRRDVVVSGIPEGPALVPENFPTDLRYAQLYQVETRNLRGYIRPLGHMHGLNLAGENNVPITAPFAATMNLEHYCERGRAGKFTPRNEVAQTYEVERDSIVVHFAPHPEWAVTSSVRYTRRDDNEFDVLFSFLFDRDYTRFEAFIASYFWGKQIPHVAAGGSVFRPDIEPPSQLFFPRDDDAREQVGDGRWDFLTDVKLSADTYSDGMLNDAPITIHRPDGTDWAFVQMVDARECSAVSVNTFAYAQDFSLIGRDVSAGDIVDVRARVMYRELGAPDDAIELYRAWQADIDAE